MRDNFDTKHVNNPFNDKFSDENEEHAVSPFSGNDLPHLFDEEEKFVGYTF